MAGHTCHWHWINDYHRAQYCCECGQTRKPPEDEAGRSWEPPPTTNRPTSEDEG